MSFLGITGGILARILLKNLTKRFGNVVAVDKLSLEVKDKEFVVLLGPSGCGKTTVLRCIAGLETPDEGEIYIGDRLVNEMEPKERDVAMVFQSYALYPHMSVFDNIAFPLENAGVARNEIKEKVQGTAKLLKIENLLERKPKQLSGGQRQRVALGRAMVREPRVFLMDEPLSNLDAKLRVYMRAELKKLQKDVGITTIYVTHDQVEAMTMGDRVAILNEGVLQQFNHAAEIYSHPVNVFVAGFIGTPPTNLFDCNLSREAPYSFEAGVFKYQVPGNLDEKAKEWPSSLVLGVRPQDVRVYKKGNEGLIKAELEIDEPLGDRKVFDLKVGDYTVKALVDPDFKAGIGEKLWIEFDEAKIYVFDKKTGKVLA
jgi:multiple sugar transport system ATP-binding protein